MTFRFASWHGFSKLMDKFGSDKYSFPPFFDFYFPRRAPALPISHPNASVILYSELRHGQLIRESQRHLGMLLHVVEVEKFNLILGGVDLLIAIFEITFDYKG